MRPSLSRQALILRGMPGCNMIGSFAVKQQQNQPDTRGGARLIPACGHSNLAGQWHGRPVQTAEATSTASVQKSRASTNQVKPSKPSTGGVELHLTPTRSAHLYVGDGIGVNTAQRSTAAFSTYALNASKTTRLRTVQEDPGETAVQASKKRERKGRKGLFVPKGHEHLLQEKNLCTSHATPASFSPTFSRLTSLNTNMNTIALNPTSTLQATSTLSDPVTTEPAHFPHHLGHSDSHHTIQVHHPVANYPYTPDLLKLESFRPCFPTFLPESCQVITTPLNLTNWELALGAHPDRHFVHYILEGIRNGFHIGFNYKHCTCKSTLNNMASADTNQEPVENYLMIELQTNRIIQVPPEYVERIQVSRFGVIPKANQPGKWRLILDLSSPDGRSVNDGIDPDLCSMAYITVDKAVSRVLQLGRNALLAKVDIEHAYRNIPVHCEDRHLLGMRWQGRVYIDSVLPFGLRSAPKIFSSVADALEWILLQHGVSLSLHYLDDFFTAGKANSDQCMRNLQLICAICKWLGIPLKRQKIEGPAMILTLLGIELDTTKSEIRLPAEKVKQLQDLLEEWRCKKRCQKRTLLSLIGKLSHACKVVVAGRIFLRRMIETAKSARRLSHWVLLNKEFQSDLEWWRTFLNYWNGRSMMEIHSTPQSPDVTIFTDASGSWGCGASWGNEWLQCQWSEAWLPENIAAKELLPIVLAVSVWGQQWQHQHLTVHCDNMAVVQVVNAQNCRDPSLLHLMRCLHFYTAILDISIRLEHIEGVKNVTADAISRNNLQVLFQQNSACKPQPTTIPASVQQLLITQRPDWQSNVWRALFKTSLSTVWQQAPGELTHQLKRSTGSSAK